MNAPLRLYAADRTAVVGEPTGPIDPWLARLVKLVPAEIVAVYLAGRPLAAARIENTWPVACLLLTIVVRAWGTSDGRSHATGVSSRICCSALAITPSGSGAENPSSSRNTAAESRQSSSGS